MRIGEYEVHPAADVFPMMDEERLDSLTGDIEEHGLREPIWLLGRLVLDGRNRLAACLRGRIEPSFRQYTGSEPWHFVVSQNLERRDLTPSQRAACIDAIIGEIQVEAGKRRTENGGGRPRKDGQKNLSATLRSGLEEPTGPVFDPPPKRRRQRKAAADAAALVGVSTRTMEDVIAVKQRDPELLEAVKGGKVGAGLARKITAIGDSEKRSEARQAALSGDAETARRVVKEEPAAVPLRAGRVQAMLSELRASTMAQWPWDGSALGVVSTLADWQRELEGKARDV